MCKVLLCDFELAIEPVFLETENEIFPQARFGLDQLPKLNQSGGGVLPALKDWLKNFDDSDSVAADDFKVFKVVKIMGVVKVHA